VNHAALTLLYVRVADGVRMQVMYAIVNCKEQDGDGGYSGGRDQGGMTQVHCSHPLPPITH
jgi:hypothetical protein